MDKANFHKLDIILASHVSGGDSPPLSDLENYLMRRVNSLFLIAHAFAASRETGSFVRIYRKGLLESELRPPTVRGPQGIMYLRDLCFTILFGLSQRKRFSLYIALDSLCALTGLVLREAGLVARVVFYPIDYVPERFKNALLNGMYLWMDKVCNRHCDSAWHPSPAMIEERQRRGVLKGKGAIQIVVPVGANLARTMPLRSFAVSRNRLIYSGGFDNRYGVKLILEAVSRVSKIIPQIQLVITGRGPEEQILRALVHGLRIEKNVIFLGFIENHVELEKVVATCAIGLATYVSHPDSRKMLTDVAKPKLYMACGLPVIITRGPTIADVIERTGAGIVINYDVSELTSALTSLVTNPQLYDSCRRNAIELAKQYDWENIFSNAFTSFADALMVSRESQVKKKTRL